jgi:hypothetical protein
MKKTPKQRSHKRPSKRLPQTKHRHKTQKKNDEPSHLPWLHVLSGDIEDDQFRNAGRVLIFQQNGRRELREMNLYVAERNLRSGRNVR